MTYVAQVGPQVRTFEAFRQRIAARCDRVATNLLVVRSTDDEDYWLARALRDPWQLPADQTIGLGDTLVPKGTWVVEIQWYSLRETTSTCRVYSLSFPNEFPLVVRSLVNVASRCDDAVVFQSVAGGRYILANAVHDQILRFGNWDYGWGDRA